MNVDDIFQAYAALSVEEQSDFALRVLGRVNETTKANARHRQEQLANLRKEVDDQLHDLLRAMPIFVDEQGIEPPFGNDEQVPKMDLTTYTDAVTWARSHCPHRAFIEVRPGQFYCRSCRRYLDANDIGLGGA